MAVYGVDSVAGSDFNSGLSSAPKATWAALLAAVTLASGDYILFAQRSRENVAFGIVSGLTIQQWDGRAQGIIDGGHLLEGEWLGAGNSWNTSEEDLIDANIAGLTINHDASIHSNGLSRYGCIKSVADHTALANSFEFDGGSGTFELNANGDDPNELTVEYCVGDVNGIEFSTATNVVIDGIQVQRFMDPNAAKGYGILLGAANGCTVQNCTIINCGNKGIGIVGAGAKVNNRVIGCSIAGLADNATCLVLYADANGSANNRFSDCIIKRHTHLGRDQLPITASATIVGCLTHTDVSDFSHVIDDVEYRNIVCEGLGELGTPFAGQANTYPTSNLDDWRAYPVRYVRCRGIGLNRKYEYPQLGGISFCECDLRCGTGSASANDTLFGAVSESSRKRLLFVGCSIIVDMDGAGSTFCFRMRGIDPGSGGVLGDAQIRIINCSCVDVGGGSNARTWFLTFEAGTAILSHRLTQSIFCYKNTAATFRRFYQNDTDGSTPENFAETVPPTIRIHDGNVYIGVATNLWSSHSTLSSQANFMAALDATHGLVTATVPFDNLTNDNSAAGDARISHTSELKRRRRRTTAHAQQGSNGRTWDGTPGAWQGGNRKRRRRWDLAARGAGMMASQV